MRLLLAAALAGVMLLPVQAQHNHNAGHGDYQGWSSQKVTNCCDDRDCGELKDDEIRQTETGPQVLISGQWCPVLREHYLVKGKSPDWSVAHACVTRSGEGCNRLLCFSGPGGF